MPVRRVATASLVAVVLVVVAASLLVITLVVVSTDGVWAPGAADPSSPAFLMVDGKVGGGAGGIWSTFDLKESSTPLLFCEGLTMDYKLLTAWVFFRL